MSDEEKQGKGDAHELREVLDVVSEKIPGLLDVISEKIPGLLKELRDVLYSKEAAENMGDAVATFYKKLVEAGVPKEEALEMARGYMINFRDMFKEGKHGTGMHISKHGKGMHIHVNEDDEDDEEDD